LVGLWSSELDFFFCCYRNLSDMFVDNAAGREMEKVLPVARLFLVLACLGCFYIWFIRATPLQHTVPIVL